MVDLSTNAVERQSLNLEKQYHLVSLCKSLRFVILLNLISKHY